VAARQHDREAQPKIFKKSSTTYRLDGGTLADALGALDRVPLVPSATEELADIANFVVGRDR